MSNSSIQTLLKEAEQLTRSEKLELINLLTQQLEDRSTKTDLNLADFFQNSPLVGIDIELNRQVDIDRHEIEL